MLAARPTEERDGARLDPRLWEAVDRLLDRVSTVSDARAHRVELLKADRLRRLGRRVPPALLEDERASVLRSLAAPLLLARVREACVGPLLVLKGPEVARLYPSPALRSFDDLDVLVPDPGSAQRSLLDAGFVEVGDPALYFGIHHLRPLHLPGFPLVVEVHGRPKWVDGVPELPGEALLEVAQPAVDGALRLPPAALAVVLAAHGWAHAPLEQLGRLIDVAAVCQVADRRDAERLAAQWGVGRLWRTTAGAVDALLFGARPTWPLRTWARGLPAGREPTVLENHVERVLAGYAALPPRLAVKASVAGLRRTFGPHPGEGWSRKGHRARRALTRAGWRRSWHEGRLGHLQDRPDGEGDS